MSSRKFSKTALLSFLIPPIYIFSLVFWFSLESRSFSNFLTVIVFLFYALGGISVVLGTTGIIFMKKHSEKLTGLWAAILGILGGMGLILFMGYFDYFFMRNVSVYR